MVDNYHERVEAQWQTELDTLKRLTAMRKELLDTQGIVFDFTKFNGSIKFKILDLCNAGKARDWNDIAETDVLSDMEHLVAVHKCLTGSTFPYPTELRYLGNLISNMATYTHWE